MPRDAITTDVVRCLVREQFPRWAGLEIRPVDLDGWDNTAFRLGDDMSARLPSDDPYVAQTAKEHRGLPTLAPHLPYPIPVPLARGVPGCGFHRPWLIFGWIDGQPAALAPVHDLERGDRSPRRSRRHHPRDHRPQRRVIERRVSATVTDPGVRRSAHGAGRRGPCGGRTPRSSRRAPRAATSTRLHCRAHSADRRR